MVLFLGLTAVSAQKYGHLNYGNLLGTLPETQQADQQLEAYQKSLITKGDSMAVVFKGNVAKFITEQQAGIMSPKQQQERQDALTKEQDAIKAYEQEVATKVQAKREELIKPIVDKLDKAIQAVGKENGYTMIFDTSVFNAILFAKDADDVTALVKAKMGAN